MTMSLFLSIIATMALTALIELIRVRRVVSWIDCVEHYRMRLDQSRWEVNRLRECYNGAREEEETWSHYNDGCNSVVAKLAAERLRINSIRWLNRLKRAETEEGQASLQMRDILKAAPTCGWRLRHRRAVKRLIAGAMFVSPRARLH